MLSRKLHYINYLKLIIINKNFQYFKVYKYIYFKFCSLFYDRKKAKYKKIIFIKHQN